MSYVFVAYYCLMPLSFLLQIFRCSRYSIPLSQLFCRKSRIFEISLILLTVWYVIDLRSVLFTR